ncbi:hypothetical protein K1719_031698 [Acacia pycnantha]|nr:hypothetical protein K1719_031698 [Acacia pycnantha]
MVNHGLAGVQDEIAGSHVFVCAHASHDVRCGPVLVEKFNEEIGLRGPKTKVQYKPKGIDPKASEIGPNKPKVSDITMDTTEERPASDSHMCSEDAKIQLADGIAL